MKQKIILFKARKYEPTMTEIEKLIKQRDVTIANATLDFLDKILSHFRMYQWNIYLNDGSPICPDVYFYYKDFIRKNYKKARYISMEELIENNEIFPLPKGVVALE